ncbi:MAG: hypothetical protein ACI8YQ_002377 [Polaribacter sp.]|jgi:hypothetical protein
MNPTIISKPTIEISKSLLEQLETFTAEESQVIVHCIYNSGNLPWMRIRIQPATFLYDKNSDHRSELAHVENIVMAPNWQHVPETGEAFFSLIFSGLPKGCTVFDLIELNEACPFRALGVSRNNEDVYFISLR